MYFLKISCRAISVAISCMALAGCATTGQQGSDNNSVNPLAAIGGLVGIGAAPGGTQAEQYIVNSEYARVFAAAKTAAASLSMATITSADSEIGLIQVKRGAAKNINITVKRIPKGSSVKIDVVNMAGIWALMDPKTDAPDIIKKMSDVLGVSITAGASPDSITPSPDSTKVTAVNTPIESVAAAPAAVAQSMTSASAPAPAVKSNRRARNIK